MRVIWGGVLYWEVIIRLLDKFKMTFNTFFFFLTIFVEYEM